VNALFRRVDALRRPPEEKQVIRRGALTLDSERMSVTWNSEVVLLSLTEFWIVYALTKHPGHVKNRQQLMDAANVVLDDNTITSHIKRIRRKFQVVDPASTPCTRCTAWDIAGSSSTSRGPLRRPVEDRADLRVQASYQTTVAGADHAGAALGRLPVRARWNPCCARTNSSRCWR
jgi:hypothetical protein